MSTDILIHQATRRALDNFARGEHHALLLEGPRGAGKTTLLDYLLAKDAVRPEDVVAIDPSDTVGIEAVRELRARLRLAPKNTTTFVRIDGVERLTHEAQNAFLKLLEEPPANTRILMSVTDKSALLPTIVSRTLVVPVLKPPKHEVLAILSSGRSEAASESLYALSEGWPGAAHASLDTDSDLAAGLRRAKEILGMSLTDRLKAIPNLTKDKESLATLLMMLEKVARAGLKSSKDAASENSPWVRRLEAIGKTQEGLKVNVTGRLLLTRLMIDL